jgi:hypothetical protein
MTEGTDTDGAAPDPPSAEPPSAESPAEPPAEPPLTPVAAPTPERGDRGMSRQIALGVVVFVATLVLLIGATAIVRRETPTASASGAPVASLAATPSGAPSASSSAAPSAAPSNSPGPVSPAPSGSAAASALPSTPVATPLPSPATLVGAGDIGDCDSSGDEATAAIVARIPGTVFTAGDNAYSNGSAKAFADCYDPSWGAFKDRTRPAAGNHDWETSGAAGYLGYFGDDAKGPDGKTWYSYEAGTWHIIVLDSDCRSVGGCGTTSPQGRWLASDLAASDARCTMAIWHHPRFSSGFHGNDKSVAPFWTALYAAGVDLIVNGHDHDYERFAPQDPSGKEDRERGIREFVVGTGGTPLRDFLGAPKANSELRARLAFGVIEFTLGNGTYEWTYHLTKTDFSDHGQQACH